MAVADQRILQGVAATLSWQPTDSDGIAAAPAGAVTVGVTRADGTTLVAAGTATSGTGADPRTVTLTPAQTALLDVLTVTWTDTGDNSTHTTRVEIAGGYYLTVAEIRALPNLADTSKFTNAELVAARRWFEDTCEAYTNLAFVPRYRRQWFAGNGNLLRPPFGPLRSVRSVRTYSDTTTYSAFTADQLADIEVEDWSLRYNTWTTGDRNLLIEIEYGYDRPPTDISEAAKEAVRQRLLDNQQGPVVLSVADGAGGTTRYALPGGGRPTGIPSVDVVLNRYRTPAVA